MAEFIIQENSNVRLDRFIRRKFAYLPQGIIEKYLRKTYIKVNDKKAKASQKLLMGDVVIIADPVLAEINLRAEEPQKNYFSPAIISLASKILTEYLIFSCDHFIAINKPYGLAVQGGSKINISIDHALNYLNKSDVIDEVVFEEELGVPRLGAQRTLVREHRSLKATTTPIPQIQQVYKLVHRLDKDTSGILIIAKNLDSCILLGEAFKTRELRKTYLAIVSGKPSANTGSIESFIAKEKSGIYETVKETKDGKFAKTSYEVLGADQDSAAIKYTPLTGRMHQLRFHSKQLGCPILGDIKYGGKQFGRMMLHAWTIEIPTSVFGEEYVITAPMDEFFKIELSKLGVKLP